jgi:pimeloyl-ACP methyl ester carboxylesterase
MLSKSYTFVVMKSIPIIAIILCSFFGTVAQIDPLSSPYYGYGSYNVLSDSDMVASPAMYTYRPDAPVGQEFPVFMFQLGANGFGSTAINVHSYDIFLKHLASYGYIVVIVNSTQGGLVDGVAFNTTWNWFQNKCNDAQHWASTMADLNKVFVGGHSNGGLQATHFMLANSTLVKGIVYFASYPSPFFPTHNVSNYNGYVLSLAGTEDNLSTPNACRNGYNQFTSATCRYFSLISGLHHGGFGDYNNTSQPVGSIGRDSATATIRHHLVSFMESSAKNSISAQHHLVHAPFQPGVINEFLTNCPATGVSISDSNIKSKLEIYPNPASNFISLQSTKGFSTGHIRIIDLAGREQFKHNLIQGVPEVIIDISILDSGNYFVVIEEGGLQPKVEKLIVVR